MMFPLIIGAGLNTNDTAFLNHPGNMPQPGYIAMDKARFWRGQPQTIGGWERFITDTLTGICRSILPWNDLTGTLNVAFGTNSKLSLVYGGQMFDITPTLALPALALGNNPIATHNGTATVDVAQTGHPYIAGDSIVISGAAAVATVTINGTWTVSATTANTWSFIAGSNASATSTGGGAAVVVTPQRAFAAGAVDGTGGEGFGTGTYSTGGYSQPSTAAFYPGTFSLSNFGQTLIANFRGGPIYQWNNATGTPAAPLLNSPPKVTFALVVPQRQVVAFGCNQAVDGVFNPMNVRGCDLEAPTVWFPTTANNAWEETLEGGSRMVGGRVNGDQMFAWSDTCLWQAQFIGDPGQTWRFTRLGDDCGLIGPNAAEIVGQAAFWMSPDGNFRTCPLGGEPRMIISPVAGEVLPNLSPGQPDKIVAAHISQFGEIWWFYPDARDGNEVSRYVGVSIETGLWHHGTFDRTAFHAGDPVGHPLGVASDGSIYYHEKGQTADGAAISYYWETGGQYIGNADQRVLIRSIWPDFQDQAGPVQVTIYTRAYPQGTDRVKGPFTFIPSQEKRSMLADGRVVRVRVSGNSTPAFCRQGRLQFEGDGSGLQ